MRIQFRMSDLFTVFIIGLLVTAVAVASQWILRASIIIIVLGGIGAVLATAQLLVDVLGRAEVKPKAAPAYELPSYDDGNAREIFWGVAEIWGWMLALVLSIPLIGLPVALPLFVLAYFRFYGKSWLTGLVLAGLIAVFIIGVYQQIMHVYWPDSVLGDLFLDELFGN
jgi:hypothetical protein